MKRILKSILKVISKLGVFTMILTSFLYILKSGDIDGMSGAILFVTGWFCASYYFLIEE